MSHIKGVASEVVRDVYLAGTPKDVIDLAAEWRDSGVRYLVLAHVSVLQRSLRNGLAAMPPFFKIIRGLKKL